MYFALGIYLLFMLVLGIKSYYNVTTYKDYIIAGGNQTTFYITSSLLAGMIGGSTTFGIISLTAKIGFPAFWWFGVGSIGLILQALILTKKVRELNAHSLPHVARIVLSKRASHLMSGIILITWIGIIAAQFIALTQMLQLFTQMDAKAYLILIVSIPIIFYTVLGGQLSVIRTDAYQFTLLFFAILITTFFLYNNPVTNTQPLNPYETITNMMTQIEFFNENFTLAEFVTLLLIAGLAFFMGPDIFSRNLSAKDAKTAQKSTFTAAIIMGVFAIFMTLIGVWANIYMDDSINPLVDIIKNKLPAPLGILLCIGLISALVSSADTCILSAATIMENDIVGSNSIKRTRLFVIIIGALSLILALFQTDMIKLLLSAYSIYVPGLAIPLFIAIIFHNTIQLNVRIMELGIICGSTCGIISVVTQNKLIALFGIGLSILFSLLAILYQKKHEK